MDITYRRRQPASRLERELARLMGARPAQDCDESRVDFIRADEFEDG